MYWLFVSGVLMECFEEAAHGAIYETPDRSEVVEMYMTGFVDDTNGRTNDFLNDGAVIEELVRRSEKDAQMWCDLLWTSGGLLEYSKCSCYTVHHGFSKRDNPVLKGMKRGDDDRVPEIIGRKHCLDEAFVKLRGEKDSGVSQKSKR